MKKLCTLLALVLLLTCIPMAGCTTEPKPNPATDFEYVVNDLDGITIQKYVGTTDDVIVPREIEGKEVLAIGEKAFATSSVRTVVLPDTVKNIGDFAFSECTSLQSIDLSMPSMAYIGNYAFYRCTELRNVTFGDNITWIADFAFYRCSSLEKAVLPKSLTKLGNEAFAYCTWLRSVTIPKTLTDWGMYTFRHDYSLTDIEFEEGLQSIGTGAFLYCDSLPSVTLPASITNVNDMAFGSNDNLWEIIFTGDAPTIGDDAFGISGSRVPYVFYSPDASGWDSITLQENQHLLPIADRDSYPHPMDKAPIPY